MKKNNIIINFLFVFCLYYTLVTKNNIMLSYSSTLLLIIFIMGYTYFILLEIFIKRRKININNINYSLINYIFIIVYPLISIMWSDMNIAKDVFITIFVGGFIGIILILFTTRKEELDIIIKGITIYYCILLILGVYESISGNYLFHHVPEYSVLKNGIGFYYPVVGNYNTNNYASVLILLLPFTSFYNKNNKLIYTYTMFILVFINILNSDSRLALLCLFILLINYIHNKRNKQIKNIYDIAQKISITMIGIYIITYIFNKFSLGEYIGKMIEDIGVTNSTFLRLELLYGAIRMFTDNILGVGIGMSSLYIADYANVSNGSFIHSMILIIMCEYGLLYISLFIFLLSNIFNKSSNYYMGNNVRVSILTYLIIVQASSDNTRIIFSWIIISLWIVVINIGRINLINNLSVKENI